MLLADESGFTLPELLTSMAILLTIMTAFTGLLVSTSRAELDMNNRFAGPDRGAARNVEDAPRGALCDLGVSLPPVRPREPRSRSMRPVRPQAPARTISWCTVQNGTGRYGLWRYVGAACSGTGVKVADYLSAANPFTYYAQSTDESRQARREL